MIGYLIMNINKNKLIKSFGKIGRFSDTDFYFLNSPRKDYITKMSKCFKMVKTDKQAHMNNGKLFKRVANVVSESPIKSISAMSKKDWKISENLADKDEQDISCSGSAHWYNDKGTIKILNNAIPQVNEFYCSSYDFDDYEYQQNLAEWTPNKE